MTDEEQNPGEPASHEGDEAADVVDRDDRVDGDDLVEATRALLRELKLLGADGAGETDEGASGVAPIEAGATKAAMFWAAASGALVAVAWACVAIWWSGEETANQVAAIGGAAIVTAAALLSISYLMAADVRSRAEAAVATIQAREHIAVAMIEAAAAAKVAAAEGAAAAEAAEVASRPSELVALPKKVRVKYLTRPKGEKKGWTAIAIERRGEDELRYLLVRGNEKAMADAKEVSFV